MPELPIEEAIPRYKQNEARVNQFVNGGPTESYTTADGVSVPTIRKFVADINTEGEGWLAKAQDTADRAEAWAESNTPPDPLDPTSKSAKAWAAEAEVAVDALATATLGGSITFTPASLAPITLPSATWIVTDLYASGLPQFAPDDWEQVGDQLTLKRAYHIGQRIDYRYRIAQTSTLSTSTLADGSAALPALGFTNDPDTGLYRIGANILGFSAGGSERMRLTTSGAQITGLLTGTAVTQNPTDTTAGRVLKVGDFGLGTSQPSGVTDIDALNIPVGFYRTIDTALGTFPTFSNGVAASKFGYLLVWNFSSNNTVQIYVPTANGAGGGRMFYRISLVGSGWLPWRELFSNANILGAVSQSLGVPTGALRESGNNANGRFERDFSGSLECWRETLSAPSATIAAGSRFRSADVTWTFPSAFLAGSTPVVTGSVVDADCDLRLVSVSNTQAVFRVMSDVSKAGALTILAQAKGRWSSMT